MPVEKVALSRKKVAVIGAGISGLGAAWRLAGACDVTLFEAEARLGGHARTRMAGKDGTQPVDTGFIVFNHANYPHLTELFAALDVPVVESKMSFGASFRDTRFEYGLDGAQAFFAQTRNVLDPRMWMMLRDIFRFNARAVRTAEAYPEASIGELLRTMGLGKWFRERYLSPFTGAIWSTPTEKVMDFPAHALIRFMENHALLGYEGQHQWYTVQGGSIAYVTRLEAALRRLGVGIRTGAPIAGVRRTQGGAEVRAQGAEWESFDEVIFATHGDDSLKMLEDPTPEERAALGRVRYQPNDVVLHCDTSVMPKRRAVWSSWNYMEGPAKRDGQIDLTYWMNSLQPIPMDDPHFVTLNSTRPIREEMIYDRTVLRHPVYDMDMLRAQAEVARINGDEATWFCGAWMKNGFHEDGLSSAYDVADAILARDSAAAAA
ncbi:NAD(P)/FAD-dependent oxidoreductase [Roseovarius atlanticus]|uniref:NAD(P)/FAD-dependent oxidoreductase n=1 Tax=Roseovarius atlanticus TaxID=1641875 RepID=UPI001C98DAB6|nr:FAD-dependent oxidoreductase [Roseovarius atlanticus]MBY5986829.1 FAD-dependent oxidoreductase [Roseovarius atlanticus]MBY6125469.1 FAD-dependent oxidoreductase [Roseovarius atlanticus]MBY6150070.1 FAD-dependent oxidoreductase [Roseovarius atlanticus]